jgi:hypothetical protein
MEDTERDYYGEVKKEVNLYLESLPQNEEESRSINPFGGEGMFTE